MKTLLITLCIFLASATPMRTSASTPTAQGRAFIGLMDDIYLLIDPCIASANATNLVRGLYIEKQVGASIVRANAVSAADVCTRADNAIQFRYSPWENNAPEWMADNPSRSIPALLQPIPEVRGFVKAWNEVVIDDASEMISIDQCFVNARLCQNYDRAGYAVLQDRWKIAALTARLAPLTRRWHVTLPPAPVF